MHKTRTIHRKPHISVIWLAFSEGHLVLPQMIAIIAREEHHLQNSKNRIARRIAVATAASAVSAVVHTRKLYNNMAAEWHSCPRATHRVVQYAKLVDALYDTSDHLIEVD
eukprot:COSAG02_NODE_483_length_21396_cov_20.544801_7_plen_110_part_00